VGEITSHFNPVIAKLRISDLHDPALAPAATAWGNSAPVTEPEKQRLSKETGDIIMTACSCNDSNGKELTDIGMVTDSLGGRMDGWIWMDVDGRVEGWSDEWMNG